MPIKRTARVEGEVAFIPLTQGLEAVIDAADLHKVEPYQWYAQRIGRNVYAATNDRSGGKRRLLYLHMTILPGHALIDHEDRDGLNCRRSNLRPATRSENSLNSRLKVSHTSGIRGVCWDAGQGCWKAYAKGSDGRQKHLGYYTTLEAAAAARQAHSD